MTDPPNRSAKTTVWLLVAGISAFLMVATAVLDLLVHRAVVAVWPVLLIAWPVVGGVLVGRRPDHLVGKLLVLFSAFISVATAAEGYVLRSLAGQPLPATDVMAWLSVWAITPIISIVLFLVAVFPSGTVRSRWMRWPLRIALVLTVTGFAGRAILPIGVDQEGIAVTNPWGIEALAGLVPIEEALFTVVLGILALAAVDLVIRWRNSAGLERAQMQTLSFTLGFFVIAVAFTTALQFAGLPPNTVETIETMAWVPGLALQPVAIGMAVLRYRLYEIDRIVSRTVTYAVVVALSAGVFLGGVTLLSTLLPAESDLGIAASTLAVAALFNPLRRGVQRWVDRRFNRARFDGEQVVATFVASLRHQIDPADVVTGWLDVVERTMQPGLVTVWLSDAGSPHGTRPDVGPDQ